MKDIFIGYSKLSKHLYLFLLILLPGSFFNVLFSQNVQTKPTRQSSFEAFSKGDYEAAYVQFKDLLVTYSKDPLYKYYSGVCLVKMNRNSDEAVVLLRQAIQGAAVVKTLPSDVSFFLGRALQMSGKFTEAISSYNRYTELVGRKTSREFSVPEFIQECYDKKGQIEEPVIKQADIAKKEIVTVNPQNTKPIIAEVSVISVKDTLVKNVIPVGYGKILKEALDSQFKADSVINLIAEQKKVLERLPVAEKPALRAKLTENELLAASFQKYADQKYSEAETVTKSTNEKTAQKEIIPTAVPKVFKDSVPKNEKMVIKNIEQPAVSVVKNPISKADTIKNNIAEVKQNTGTFTFFKILPKPVTDPKEKVIINPEVPPGLIYRIQIAVFRNPVAPAYFKGITPVYGFKIAGTDKTNYFAGMFRRYSDAAKALAAVKAKGFKDAFVIALADKKAVSTDRAAILEKEWGKKPLISTMKITTDTTIDTIPPTLAFRVEVMRSLKPVKEDVIDGMMKMSGNRGFDIQPLENGSVVYLIGKFITFDSALEYADLMVRNGYREAKVVAWLGKREIPVETAKQLFDNMQ